MTRRHKWREREVRKTRTQLSRIRKFHNAILNASLVLNEAKGMQDLRKANE